MPKVRKIRESQPLPAPHYHSAKAQALASFSRKVGIAKRSFKSATTGMSFHAGRFGGAWMMPLYLSSGPPQEIPIAEGDM